MQRTTWLHLTPMIMNKARLLKITNLNWAPQSLRKQQKMKVQDMGLTTTSKHQPTKDQLHLQKTKIDNFSSRVETITTISSQTNNWKELGKPTTKKAALSLDKVHPYSLAPTKKKKTKLMHTKRALKTNKHGVVVKNRLSQMIRNNSRKVISPSWKFQTSCKGITPRSRFHC